MTLPGLLTAVLVFTPVMLGVGRTQGQAGEPALSGRIPPGADSSFVGSQKCRECHASTHSSWTSGRHSKMLQEAGPKSVIPAFGGPLTLHGKEYQLAREGDSYFITEGYLQDAPTKRRVDFTLGSRRVQHYLSRLSDGRIVVLPPSYDVEKKEWFHNLDIVDLEESGQVKVQVWNTNCFGCHVSGEEKGFNPDKKSFDTTWTDFGTSCERCHGPGRAHADRYFVTRKGGGKTGASEARAGQGRAAPDDRDTAIVHPKRLDPETSSTLCAQCHTLRHITRTGFTGGANYYDYFTPLLEYAQTRNHDPAYWPDGRPRRFSNEAMAFWQSQCYFKGGATCLSCHTDVHEPDIEKNAQLSGKADRLCAGCHEAIVIQGSRHSRHEAPAHDSEKSVSCVACHMPKTTISLRHRMPDHSLSVPAPENTRQFGIPNACNECHKDRSAAWSEARLAAWFPKGRREQKVADAVAFSLGANRDPAGEQQLAKIAADATRPPLIRANAIGHLRNYPTATATAGLITAAGESHPALRLVAILSLADRGRDLTVRRTMEMALKDPRRTVRMAAALGWLNAGLPSVIPADERAALDDSVNDLIRRAAFFNDDPTTQLELGKMFFLGRDWSRAVSSIRDALRLDPTIPGGRYFLGLATLGQGRIAEGSALLRSLDQSDPHRKDAEAVLARLKTP